MFLGGPGIVTNPEAEAAALNRGIEIMDCGDAATAIPECFIPGTWNGGWVGEFAQVIMDKIDAEVVVKTPANFSTEVYSVYTGGSSYTRCVYEITLGNVDWCVGDFWETQERRPLVAFSSAFELDSLRVATMPLGSDGFEAGALLDLFEPMQPSVWAVTVGMVLFTGLSLYLVEADGDSEDLAYEASLESPLLRHLQGSLKSLYLALLGFWSASPAHTPTKWPSRIICLGYAFMLYVTVASYTANLADSLVSEKKVEGRVQASLSEVLGTNKRVCVLEAMSSDVSEYVPQENVMVMDAWGSALENLWAGRCDASVVGGFEWVQYVRGNAVNFQVCTDESDGRHWAECIDPQVAPELIELQCGCQSNPDLDPAECPEECPHYKKLCSIHQVPDASFDITIPFAFPLSDALHDEVSLWVIKLRLEGLVSRLLAFYLLRPYPDVCAEPVAAEALAIESFAGLFVICGSLVLLGLLLHAVQCLLLAAPPADPAPSPTADPDRKRSLASDSGGDGGQAAAVEEAAAAIREHQQQLERRIAHVTAMATQLEAAAARPPAPIEPPLAHAALSHAPRAPQRDAPAAGHVLHARSEGHSLRPRSPREPIPPPVPLAPPLSYVHIPA